MAAEAIPNIIARLRNAGLPEPLIERHVNAVTSWRALARLREQRKGKKQETQDEAHQANG